MHGPVRAPKDAQPGPATMIVELPVTSSHATFRSELPVVID